jgi:hypothetical protein
VLPAQETQSHLAVATHLSVQSRLLVAVAVVARIHFNPLIGMDRPVVLQVVRVETVELQKTLHLIHILVGLVMETRVDPVLVLLPVLAAMVRTVELLLILQPVPVEAAVEQAQLVLMHHQSSVEHLQR